MLADGAVQPLPSRSLQALRRAGEVIEVLLQWDVDSFSKHRLLMLPRRSGQATWCIRNRCTSQMDCPCALLHLSAVSVPSPSPAWPGLPHAGSALSVSPR